MNSPLTAQRSLFDDRAEVDDRAKVDDRADFDDQASPQFEVVVTRSDRRKKSSEAILVGRELRVRIPGHMTSSEEAEVVIYFSEKFEKKYGASRIDLVDRANKLDRRYGLETPESIRWVSNQNQRWGSCTPDDRTIRLSEALVPFPDWVIDYVIVHELAHLSVPAHNDDFWALVNQYPKTERARGYLIAMATVDAES